MNKNYAVFPCKNVRLTQNYSNAYSHATQSTSTNGVKSYPIDICYGDTYLMAPCRMKSVNMTYFNDDASTNIVNQVWFQSTEKVYLANGEYDYITILVTHPDDWDYTWDKIGTIYERGTDAVNQGTDGGVDAHLDIVVGVGLHNADWVKNSFGEGVLPNSRKPEDVFYIDSKFNNVIDTQGINFKTIPADAYYTCPKSIQRDENKRQFQVDYGDTLFARNNPNGDIIGKTNKGIYDCLEEKNVNGTNWIKIADGVWCGCTNMSRVLEIVKNEEPKVEEPVIEVEQPIVTEPTTQEEDNEENNTNIPIIINKPKKGIVATILGIGGAITYYLQENWLMLLIVAFVILLVVIILYIKKRRNK